MILGTSLLDEGARGNKSYSVSVHYTRPVDGWVQLNDTYHAFSIVKGGTNDISCPGNGYLLIQLHIGSLKLNIRKNWTGYKSWNIKESFTCIDDGIRTAQLNIMFDNATFNGITEKLNKAKKSSLSLQFIYKDYTNGDTSSPLAYIHLKNISSHSDQVGSNLLNTSSTTKPRGGSTEANTTCPGTHYIYEANSFSAASSSLIVQHAAKFHTYLFTFFIILLYHVAS